LAHDGRQVKQGGFDDGVEGPVQDKLLGGRPGGAEVAGAGQRDRRAVRDDDGGAG